MRIESIIQRTGGTDVKLNGTDYHFGPTEGDLRHTCEVESDDDAQHFLGIKDGYRIAKASDVKAAQVAGKSVPESSSTPAPAPSSTNAVSASQQHTQAPASPTTAPTPAPTSKPTEQEIDRLDSMSKTELLDFAKQEGIEVNGDLPKPAILQVVRRAKTPR